MTTIFARHFVNIKRIWLKVAWIQNGRPKLPMRCRKEPVDISTTSRKENTKAFGVRSRKLHTVLLLENRVRSNSKFLHVRAFLRSTTYGSLTGNSGTKKVTLCTFRRKQKFV